VVYEGWREGEYTNAKALISRALARYTKETPNRITVPSARKDRKMPRDILAEMRLFC
jgi:hypothetical protein